MSTREQQLQTQGNPNRGQSQLQQLTPNQPLSPSLPQGRTTGLEPEYQKSPAVTPPDTKSRQLLESISDQATISSGATFQDVNNVIVKQPLLSALIRLDKKRSPYDLDAESKSAVTLRDVLNTALASNLDIKITQQIVDAKKWVLVGGVSGFLPNIVNEVNQEAIGGTYVTPAGLAVPIHNPFLTTSSSFAWTLYKGGSIIHTYKEYKHEYKASQAALKGSLNDVMSDVANLYYNLALNEVLLQIRVKAVETANALVLVNKDLYANGVNTELDVLQSQYQLSLARQQLIQQQVSRRQAAVNLATAINLNPEVDLTIRDKLVSKITLVDDSLPPGELLRLAIANRPELKRFEELRLAAIDAVKVAKGAFLPQIQGQGLVIGSASNVRNNLSLGGQSQTTGLSSAGVGVGPATGVSTLPLATGGQSNSTEYSMRSLFVLGVDVQWNFDGLGVKQLSQLNTARADARRASLEFTRSLNQVYKDVRDSYLSSLSAANMILETTDMVNYGAEELRVAEVRLKDGVGTNLDVINAQRDYINALVNKANALIQYNTAQTQLMHAIGRSTVDTLTSNVPLRE
jgi:outer membrane protein TolC